MNDFPSTLPTPNVQDYAVYPVDAPARTPMEAGQTRSRSRFTALPFMADLTWVFLPTQMDAFETWYIGTINRGALPFDITLMNGYGVQTFRCRFLTQYQTTVNQGQQNTVTASLILDTYPILDQDSLDYITANGLPDFASGAALLHTEINVTLPGPSYW